MSTNSQYVCSAVHELIANTFGGFICHTRTTPPCMIKKCIQTQIQVQIIWLLLQINYFPVLLPFKMYKNVALKSFSTLENQFVFLISDLDIQ